MARRVLIPLVLFCVASALTLALSEGLLRAGGIGPWQPFAGFEALPSMTLPDDELGWVLRPGVYEMPLPDGEAVHVSIRADGARTSPSSPISSSSSIPPSSPIPPAAATDALWLMGGSFIFGFGVDDAQTLPAQLGALTESTRCVNYGVPGYGTVQSRALFLRTIARGAPAPKRVIYGLVDFHDARNVAAPSWLYALDQAAGANPWVKVPSAVWQGGALQEYPPRGYRHWAASERYSVIYLLERGVIALRDWGTATKTETTLELIRLWGDEARAAGSQLTVALLHAPEAGETYVQRLPEIGIEMVDLRTPTYPGPDTAIPGDGHPNAKLHRLWAAQLADKLAYAAGP